MRKQLDDASIDLQWDVFQLVTIPLLTLAILLGQGHLHGDLRAVMHLAPLFAVGVLAFIGFMVRNDFNIDHIVVSGEGVFAIETKGFTKPNGGRDKADATVEFDGSILRFPGWTTKAPLEQARGQATWLAKWLGEAVGAPIRVLPVLALPGWYVKRTGRGDVRVFNGKELAGLLKARGAQSLSPQDVQRVAHQLEQRCRTVEPMLSERMRAA